MTIDNVSAGALIDPDWGNAVADQLNDLPAEIQQGLEVYTVDGGLMNVVFGEPFASVPVVTATRYSGSTSQVGVHLSSVTQAGFTARITINNATQTASTGSAFGWIAVGPAV